MMIVVTIIGVLASIAYPNYQDYIQRSRRVAATACMAELVQFMERYYTTNLSYLGAEIPVAACRNDLSNYYTFRLQAPPTASTFLLEAVPRGAQLADSTCGTLGLNQMGARTQSGGGSGCWR